jgi:hypothetical protein
MFYVILHMRIISRKKYNRTVCLSHTRRRMAANPEAARRRQLIGEGHFALVISTRSQATLSPILTKSCLTPRINPLAYIDPSLANPDGIHWALMFTRPRLTPHGRHRLAV